MRAPQGLEWIIILVVIGIPLALILVVVLVVGRNGSRASTPPSAPPPGWYVESGRWRWWDGQAWASMESAPPGDQPTPTTEPPGGTP